MGIAMMGVMHIYFNSTQLLFKAFIGIKNLYDARPVSIHVLGQPAVGDLKRPFETVSMFGRTFPSCGVAVQSGTSCRWI
ncbi:phosphate transport-domain-containing protein, partial [Flammula alnicola]